MKISVERRKFFEKFGVGALAAGVMGAFPFKLFASNTKKQRITEKKISVNINPMAVKRTRKN